MLKCTVNIPQQRTYRKEDIINSYRLINNLTELLKAKGPNLCRLKTENIVNVMKNIHDKKLDWYIGGSRDVICFRAPMLTGCLSISANTDTTNNYDDAGIMDPVEKGRLFDRMISEPLRIFDIKLEVDEPDNCSPPSGDFLATGDTDLENLIEMGKYMEQLLNSIYENNRALDVYDLLTSLASADDKPFTVGKLMKCLEKLPEDAIILGDSRGPEGSGKLTPIRRIRTDLWMSPKEDSGEGECKDNDDGTTKQLVAVTLVMAD